MPCFTTFNYTLMAKEVGSTSLKTIILTGVGRLTTQRTLDHEGPTDCSPCFSIHTPQPTPAVYMHKNSCRPGYWGTAPRVVAS